MSLVNLRSDGLTVARYLRCLSSQPSAPNLPTIAIQTMPHYYTTVAFNELDCAPMAIIPERYVPFVHSVGHTIERDTNRRCGAVHPTPDR